MELLSSPEAWMSLVMLSFMEIVLGVDNIVFITIVCGRLPQSQQVRARRLGLMFALVTRILLLLSLNWIAGLTEPIFHLGRPWGGRDLILWGGGAFLIYKAIKEFMEDVEDEDAPGTDADGSSATTLPWVIVQIMFLDIVFSLDSVITAVGMAQHVEVMVTAILIAVMIMATFIGPVGDFIQANPSIKVLALSSLLLIGLVLILDGSGFHVEKTNVYAALGFSLMVQLLDLRRIRRAEAYERAHVGQSAIDG
jgi:predicted tellurium resistance membrane protein TerC